MHLLGGCPQELHTSLTTAQQLFPMPTVAGTVTPAANRAATMAPCTACACARLATAIARAATRRASAAAFLAAAAVTALAAAVLGHTAVLCLLLPQRRQELELSCILCLNAFIASGFDLPPPPPPGPLNAFLEKKNNGASPVQGSSSKVKTTAGINC